MYALSRSRVLSTTAAVFALLLALVATAGAQTQPQENPHEHEQRQESVEFFHLTHATQDNALNDILQALRNVIGVRARVYSDSIQRAIIVRGTAEEIDQARKIVAELDRPIPQYKLTFTITETEDGKLTGTQRYTLLAASGEKVSLKEVHRVPVITGKPGTDSSDPAAQVQYIDVGLTIGATFAGSTLHAQVEKSAVADEKSNVNIQDPLIRLVSLTEGTTVTPGKPAVLGSFDIPNSTRHREVQVLVERME